MEDFNSKYSGEQVESYLDQIANGNTNNVGAQLEVTYFELVELRSNKNLIPGVEYRITDYDTTTTQESTQAMLHPFDVIVTALSSSELSEKAKAVNSKRDIDGYFANSSLGNWELDYSIDNDIARFSWADETNGKGVIYRMVDEFGNECPYDFKNITLLEAYDASNTTYYYTFDNEGEDYSLNGSKCFNNVIKKYINSAQQINRIVFKCGNREVSDNSFDCQCYNNTMADARSLCFGRECYNNKFDGLNVACSIGIKFRNNHVGSETQGLTIGMSCTNNDIGSQNYYCVFEDYVRNCKTGKYTYYSRFGANSSYIIMGIDSESTTPYIRRFIVEPGCSYLYVYKDGIDENTYVNDIKIHKGTSGTSSSYRTIALTRGNIEIGLNSDSELVQFTSANVENKVDKVDGKQLSTEDFTTLLKQRLESLSNYDDTAIQESVSKLRTDLDTLVSGDTTTAIKTFNEVIAFLDGLEDTEDLASIIAAIEQQIAAKYTKPSDGIPKTDLAPSVQTSLGKADTALQSYTEQYKGTVTKVKINGSEKTPDSNGVVDLGTITGEGDGSSSGGSGAYSEVNHGTADTTFTLTPNTFHIWDEVTELNISFGSETSGVANEFLFQFTSGATATTLTLPDDIKWANDSTPNITSGKTYIISIVNNLAVFAEF